jgi:hypothetical protein
MEAKAERKERAFIEIARVRARRRSSVVGLADDDEGTDAVGDVW